jgi:hypothetical protein
MEIKAIRDTDKPHIKWAMILRPCGRYSVGPMVNGTPLHHVWFKTEDKARRVYC